MEEISPPEPIPSRAEQIRALGFDPVYLTPDEQVEVLALTDAHVSEQGIYVARRKRSHDNIVQWSPRLRSAWDAAVAVRASIRARRSNRFRPLPSPEQRFIFVANDLAPLSTGALSSGWAQMMRSAVEEGIITREQRFTLHGLKHRGVTDTRGSRRRKQIASGHQTEAMVQLYDHDVPVVAPASPEAFVPPKPWQE